MTPQEWCYRSSQDEDAGGTAGTLILTEHDTNRRISSAAIHKLSEEIF
jgi:hypothetical protein